MINRLFLILITSLTLLSASLIDFKYINDYLDNYENKHYQEALNNLKALNKDTPEINYNIANIYYKMGKYKEAIKYYKRAVGKGVDEADRVYNLANCYFKQNQLDNAIFAYKIVLLHKDDKDARYNLFITKEKKFRKEIEAKEKKKRKTKKRKDGKSKNKDKKKIKKKLTKEELKKLEELKKKMAFKKRIKNMLNDTLKNKKIPILLYKIKDGAKQNIDLKPW